MEHRRGADFKSGFKSDSRCIIVDSLDFFLSIFSFVDYDLDTGMMRCEVCDYFDIASICARSRVIITQCGWFEMIPLLLKPR